MVAFLSGCLFGTFATLGIILLHGYNMAKKYKMVKKNEAVKKDCNDGA
jgi:hypothetical protein